MKKQILLLFTSALFLVNSAIAQGNWVGADQTILPTAVLSSAGTASASGSFEWVSTADYQNANHGARLTYALPPSLIASTGTPSIVFANNNMPVPEVTFTNTGRTWTCEFAPNAIFAAGTKLIFSISNMQIKDDQAYTAQQLSQFITFLSSPANESLSDNSTSVNFQTVVNGPLPVDLLDFRATLIDRAQNANVQLDWKTTSEHNTNYFQVQRSVDATEWFDIDEKIPAAGNSTTEKKYNSFDNEPLLGVSYYRLKQVDLDQNFFLSDIRKIIYEGAGRVTMFPNPVVENLNVKLELGERALMEIKVVTMEGRVARSVTAWSERGVHTMTLDLSALTNGVYEVNVYKNNTIMHTDKVQKK